LTTDFLIQGLSWCPPGRQPHRSTKKRATRLASWATVYLLLWASAIHFSDTISQQEANERALARKMYSEFMYSPKWAKARDVVHNMGQLMVYKARTTIYSLYSGFFSCCQKIYRKLFDYYDFDEPFDPEEIDPYVVSLYFELLSV
jgi:hypothetical protein